MRGTYNTIQYNINNTISVSKCCMMHIGKQKRDTTVHMSGDIVPVVESVRDLGVLISNDLQPSVHINDIVSRAHKRAAAILCAFVTRLSLIHI